MRLGARKKIILPVLAGVALAALSVWLVSAFVSTPMDRARKLEKAGKVDAANRIYRQILTSNPSDVSAARQLAINLMLAREFDEALPYQEKVVRLDTRDAQTRIELAFNYLNHQERPDQAIRMFKEASVLQPSPRNLTFLAQAQIRANDTGAAETTLRRALDVDPKYAYAYRVMHSLFIAHGRTVEAAEVTKLASTNGIALNDTGRTP